MKKIFFLFVFAHIASGMCAQVFQKLSLSTENFAGDTYSVVRTDSLNNPQKFLNAKQWLARTFADYKKAVEFEDEASGKIVVKSMLPVSKSMDDDNTNITYEPTLMFTLTIDVKPDKYRLKFDDMKVSVTRVERTPLGSKRSNMDYTLSGYVGMFRERSYERANISVAITDFLNSAIPSIEIVDDF